MKLFTSWRLRKPETDNASVYISEKFGVRTLHIGSDTIQSAMRISRPNDLEIVYTRSMMAFLLFKPQPQQILMIGLGGGSLAKFIYHRLPHARVTAVEVNPEVLAIARQFFFLPPDDERFCVIVADGATYVESAPGADVILLDGYDAESQVAALATADFYRACAQALSDSGMLVVNLWGGDRSFSDCIARMASVFGPRVLCLPAGKPGNVVALAFKQDPGQPLWKDLRARARDLQIKFELEFTRFVEDLAIMNPHNSERLL